MGATLAKSAQNMQEMYINLTSMYLKKNVNRSMFQPIKGAFMLKTISSLAIGLIIASAASVSVADTMGPQGDKFYEEAAHFVNACTTSPCKAPYTSAAVYDVQTRTNQLSPALSKRMTQVAVAQANIWADTILAGDYYADGKTRLDKVTAFYKNNVIAGYKISYSERAWDTSNCQFNGDLSTLKTCAEGRIVEESYVSPDTKTYFSNEEQTAQFATILN
jgi:hypothetical protein